MSEFIHGLKLSELFYREAVKPILDEDFRDLKYSAALLGFGSDVLGYDTPISTDHMWGPRLYLFVEEADYQTLADQIMKQLGEKLPLKFYGYSTNFGIPDTIGVRLAEFIENGPVKPLIQIHTLPAYFEEYVGFNPYNEVGLLDWLTIPEQKLLVASKGAVFYDGLEKLNSIRQKLVYYPRDVWLYLLAAQWTRISQEEAFVGRCGDVGDELGSQLIAARLIHDLMKLCFLMERHYAPYSKWFGTAFSHLRCAADLNPIFQGVLLSKDWKEREAHLSSAYQIVARMHNGLEITRPLDTEVSYYYNRPYLVIHGERFAEEIKQAIKDDAVRNLEYPIGSIDQFVNSTDVLSRPSLCAKIKSIYS
jgi:hypothetical protein